MRTRVAGFWLVGVLAVLPVRSLQADDRDRVVSRVNDEIITQSELEKAMKGNFNDPVYRRKVLQNLVVRKLFAQTAKKYQIEITEEEVDRAIEKEMKQIGSKEAFYRHVKETYGLTHPQEEYTEIKRNGMLIQKLYYYLYVWGSRRPKEVDILMTDYVAPEEIRAYYDQNREQFKEIDEAEIGRIALVYTTPEQRVERLKEAESVLRHLNEGADFRILAAYHSDANRGQFGKMSPIRRSDSGLPKEIHELIFDTMKPGETSGIIDDGQAINIIRLEKRVNEKEKTYEEAQLKISSLLENQKRAENEKRLRDELVSKAYIWPETLFDR